MVNGVRTRHDHIEDVLIRREVLAGESLRTDEDRFDGGALKDRTRTLEACNSHFLITRIRKPIGIDDRVDRRVVGNDGDVPSREWRD